MLELTPWTPALQELRWPALVLFAAHLVYVKVLLDLMKARYKHKIFAPATSGHPDFDRAFRVQQNFVEHYPSFVTSLCVCSIFVNAKIAAFLGAIWVVFRLLHSNRYRKERLGKWIFYYTGPQYASIGLMYLTSVGRIIFQSMM